MSAYRLNAWAPGSLRWDSRTLKPQEGAQRGLLWGLRLPMRASQAPSSWVPVRNPLGHPTGSLTAVVEFQIKLSF